MPSRLTQCKIYRLRTAICSCKTAVEILNSVQLIEESSIDFNEEFSNAQWTTSIYEFF